MTEIVRETVERHFHSGAMEKLQAELAETAVRRAVGRWDNTPSDTIVRGAFKREMDRLVAAAAKEAFRAFEVTVAPRPGGGTVAE
jgi:hypothetical protein